MVCGGRRPTSLETDAQDNIEDFILHFGIQGLPAEQFAPLFALSDDALQERGAVRTIADGPRPCRISP